jgi:hypothetical protein
MKMEKKEKMSENGETISILEDQRRVDSDLIRLNKNTH